MNNNSKKTFWEKLKKLIKNGLIDYQIQKFIIKDKVSELWKKNKKII